MKIRVTTEQLRSTSQEASAYIDKVSAHFENIESVVKASASYWDGEGQCAYQKSYVDRIDRIQHALSGFRDNISDLKQIAGIYEVAEAEATELAAPLSSDVIV